jgi:hypothetical protein
MTPRPVDRVVEARDRREAAGIIAAEDDGEVPLPDRGSHPRACAPDRLLDIGRNDRHVAQVPDLHRRQVEHALGLDVVDLAVGDAHGDPAQGPAEGVGAAAGAGPAEAGAAVERVAEQPIPSEHGGQCTRSEEPAVRRRDPLTRPRRRSEHMF